MSAVTAETLDAAGGIVLGIEHLVAAGGGVLALIFGRRPAKRIVAWLQALAAGAQAMNRELQPNGGTSLVDLQRTQCERLTELEAATAHGTQLHAATSAAVESLRDDVAKINKRLGSGDAEFRDVRAEVASARADVARVEGKIDVLIGAR